MPRDDTLVSSLYDNGIVQHAHPAVLVALSEVATSVIYTLCCERNYCNQLLVAMVKDKLLEGVRMLVDLGADVNFGEEPDTPICLAVAARDRDMVEYFLTKVTVARKHVLFPGD